MKTSKFFSGSSAEDIDRAAKSLFEGNLVAFPTETVYGLGADASNEDAVKRIYQVKDRPVDHPLIVHVNSMQAMGHWVSSVPEYATELARVYWPGPMTLILKRSCLAKDFITGHQDTVGIRIPGHPIALALLDAFSNLGGHGIAAPSANKFGQVSPTSADAVFEEISQKLGSTDLILDGGECDIGIESTIIDCTTENPILLRPGAISVGMIQDSVGNLLEYEKSNTSVRTSGSFERHYSPRCKIIIGGTPVEGEGYFAMIEYETPKDVIRLGSPRNADEFAHLLYKSFRRADQIGLKSMVVELPTTDGIGFAIRDRILKAANGRHDIP